MLDVNAFGDARIRKWAKRINNAQNARANRGFEKAGASHPKDAHTNYTQYKKTIKDNAPSIEGRSQMNTQVVGSLGSGLWKAMA